MTRQHLVICTVFLFGTLCYSCETNEKPVNASFVLKWPDKGKTSIELLDGKPVMLNAFEGNVFVSAENVNDSIMDCYDAAKPFEPEYLISLGNALYLLNDSTIQSIYPKRDSSFKFQAGMRYYRNKFIPAIKHKQSVFLQAGYNGPSRSTPEQLKQFGQQAAVWRINFVDEENQKGILEQPVAVPKIPSQWNDGNHYRFTAYLTQFNGIGVFSYEKYPAVYLFDLESCLVIDSIEFESLAEYGLEPLSPKATIIENRDYHQKQPAYNAAFLQNNHIVRVLRVYRSQWLMDYDLKTGVLSKKRLPKGENTTLFQCNNELLSIQKVENHDGKMFNYLPFRHP